MRLSTDQHILPPRIQEAFTDSTLLFLGYGLADWNFRVLFRALVEYLDRAAPVRTSRFSSRKSGRT